MTPAMSETPAGIPSNPPDDRLRMVIDDSTADRLRAAAERRHVPVETLMAELLRVASHGVDELLGPEDSVGETGDDS